MTVTLKKRQLSALALAPCGKFSGIQSGDSTMPLQEWLVSRLDGETCPSCKWRNREDGVFCIIWIHQKNGKFAEEDATIFKEWSIYTGSYKASDNLGQLKSRFRCVLKKSKIVELKVQDEVKMKGKPCKVFRIDMTKFAATTSTTTPDLIATTTSVTSHTAAATTIPSAAITDLIATTTSTTSTPVAASAIVFSTNTTDLFAVSASTPSTMGMEPLPGTSQMYSVSPVYGQEGSDVSTGHAILPNQCDQRFNSQTAFSNMPWNTSVDAVSRGVTPIQIQLPSITEIDFGEIPDLLSLIQTPEDQPSLGMVQESGGLNESQAPKRKMESNHDSSGLVKKIPKEVDDSGQVDLLYFGRANITNRFYRKCHVRMASDQSSESGICFPDPMDYEKDARNRRDITKLKTIFDEENMKGGLLLEYEKGNIWATRRCMLRVFFSNFFKPKESRKLERNVRTLIFNQEDFERAYKEFQLNHSKLPSNEVYLGFGQPWYHGDSSILPLRIIAKSRRNQDSVDTLTEQLSSGLEISHGL